MPKDQELLAGAKNNLPYNIEVWCCPGKRDWRISAYLDVAFIDKVTQTIGYGYRRESNNDFCTKIMSKKDMQAWLGDSRNPAEPRVVLR